MATLAPIDNGDEFGISNSEDDINAAGPGGSNPAPNDGQGLAFDESALLEQFSDDDNSDINRNGANDDSTAGIDIDVNQYKAKVAQNSSQLDMLSSQFESTLQQDPTVSVTDANGLASVTEDSAGPGGLDAGSSPLQNSAKKTVTTVTTTTTTAAPIEAADEEQSERSCVRDCTSSCMIM
jgi:hypothetical protein